MMSTDPLLDIMSTFYEALSLVGGIVCGAILCVCLVDLWHK